MALAGVRFVRVPAWGALFVPLGAGAQFLPPDTALRLELQWLADRGVIELPLGTWPLSRQALVEALAVAPPVDSSVGDSLARARALIQRRDAIYAWSRTQAQALANFGDSARPGTRVGLRGEREWGVFMAQLDVAAGHDPGVWRLPGSGESGVSAWLEGSALSVSLAGAVLSLNQLDRFWGPGWQGSLVWGNAAPPVPGVSLSRAAGAAPQSDWLRWIGPWNAVFFMGPLAEHQRPERPWLMAMRLTAQPITGLELGASRGILWGGQGRDQSFNSWGNAWLGRGVHRYSPAQSDNSAQLASLDVRWSVARWGAPLAFYAQAVAEDSINGLPRKWFGMGGVEVSERGAAGVWMLALEYAETAVNGWSATPLYRVAYSNADYRSGYTQRRQPLGYPTGGDARLGSLHAALDASRSGRWSVDAYFGTADRSGMWRPPSAPQFTEATRIGGAQLAWRSRFQALNTSMNWQLGLGAGGVYQRGLKSGRVERALTGELEFVLGFQ